MICLKDKVIMKSHPRKRKQLSFIHPLKLVILKKDWVTARKICLADLQIYRLKKIGFHKHLYILDILFKFHLLNSKD
jgi:hypothetical protein